MRKYDLWAYEGSMLRNIKSKASLYMLSLSTFRKFCSFAIQGASRKKTLLSDWTISRLILDFAVHTYNRPYFATA